MWIVVDGLRVAVDALNVSVGGAAVHSTARATLGESVRLEVELVDKPAVELDAEVVRAEHGILGLRFLALGQRALEALLEASGISSSSEQDDPSGIRHVGPDEAPGSRRGA
jgi:hypothetical protein